MKISKLFHWLYAFLMFLPIVLFIPNAFYYGFNEHAIAQERTEQQPVYYETNEVVDNSSFISGNVYLWNDNYTIDVQYGNQQYFFVKPLQSYLDLNSSFNLIDPMYFYCGGSGNINLRQGSNILVITNISLPIVYLSPYGTTSLNMPSYIYSHFSVCDFDVVKEYQPVVYSMSISDSMFQAWQSTWDLPLLQWTHTSFVAQPFTYITGLFGVPSDSTLNYIFAYFVSISICWLVFDLLMYVPNLAHRWLDRSALE